MPPDFDRQAREILTAYCDHVVTLGSRFDLHAEIAAALHAAYHAGQAEMRGRGASTAEDCGDMSARWAIERLEVEEVK